MKLKKELTTNRDRRQQELDPQFPSDHTMNTAVNAVFSGILRRGYFQAVGWLESFTPFFSALVTAGMSEKDAWDSKILNYVKSVNEKIQQVHTLTKEPTPSAVIMGMFRATRMLNRYAELGFVSHPDVAMCLVVASLEREGKATEWITSELDSLGGVLGKAESTMKKLKGKNPEFFR